MQCNIRLKYTVIHLRSGSVHVKAGKDGQAASKMPEIMAIFNP